MLQDNQPLDAAIKLNSKENEKKNTISVFSRATTMMIVLLAFLGFPSTPPLSSSSLLLVVVFSFFLLFFSFFAALSSVSGSRTSGCCIQPRGNRAVGLIVWTVIGTTRRSNKSRVRFMLGLGKGQREKAINK